MHLSTYAEAALDRWLASPTWHTSDDLDLSRWYEFVYQYQLDHGYTVDEAGLRELIGHKAGGHVSEELRQVIRERIASACRILDSFQRAGRRQLSEGMGWRPVDAP